MKIALTQIGPTQTPYIVAEISCNHLGRIELAKKTIMEALRSGASAVKIQCYTAEGICASEGIIPSGPWAGRSYKELYKEAETPPWMVEELARHAKAYDYTLFASVFDFEGVDLVRRLNFPAIKIASFELVDIPLIERAASVDVPVIISTGMGTNTEIIEAVNAFERGGGTTDNLALLHCVSSYPAKAEEANLTKLRTLSILGGYCDVGFSDHTIGVGTAVGAVALGASIIEKHFILDRNLGGPDAAFSMEPSEFRQLVSACHDAWKASKSAVVLHQGENLVFRKSLYVTKRLACGDVFAEDNLRPMRPAGGLAPSLYASVLGRKATRDLEAGTPLELPHVDGLS